MIAKNINLDRIKDKNKTGFVAVFSKPLESNKKNYFYRVNSLTSFIFTENADKNFYNDFYFDNKLYNRMKFLSSTYLTVINILRDEKVNDIEKFYNIPVYYRTPTGDLDLRNDKENPKINVKVFNLTFEEFFNLDIAYFMLKEDPNKTIFFFETEEWAEVINRFYMIGIIVTGGSTNQRHIFNSLHYSFSILLTSLFGKRFTQMATNFMQFKNEKKDIFKPNFHYNSIENKIFRLFNEVFFKNKDQSFVNITANLLKSFSIISNWEKISPWDALKFWFCVRNKHRNLVDKENNEYLIKILIKILEMLLEDKKEEEIILYLHKNYNTLNNEIKVFKDNQIEWFFSDDERFTREVFFKMRFLNSSPWKYTMKNKFPIEIEKPESKFLNQKREYHTTSSRFEKSLHLKLSDIKLNGYFSHLEQIATNKTLDSKSKQLKLENSFLEFFQNLIDDLKKKNNNDKNMEIKIKYLFEYKERLDILHSNNALFRKFGNLSFLLINIKWIFLTSSILSISNNKGYNSTANALGENILFNLFLDLRMEKIDKTYKNSKNLSKYSSKLITSYKNKKAYESINFFDDENIKYWKNISFHSWLNELEVDFKLTLSLGDLFISIFTNEFSNEKPLFLRKAKEDNYNDPYIITFNPEVDKSLINEFLDIPANKLPLLHNPDEWKEGQIGGYLTSYFKNNDLITNPKPHSNSHKTSNLNKIYDVVNHLNSIEFEINNLLLNYLINEGSWFFERIKSISENDEWVYNQLTIEIAKAYSRAGKFYFNHYLDWRGRIYNSSFYLNYQGNELGSSLLLFKKGEKLTENGKYYFYIALANAHNENNISKSSFWERYNWVIFNYQKIINLDKDLISNAEKPFNFLSLALTLREYNYNNNYLVKNPIFLDATCSGMQHVSALIRDFELATLTNLNKSTNKDLPEDFYSDVIKKVNKEINDYGYKNITYSNLKNVELTRKIAKESIMTVVYNVSIFGMKEQLANKTRKKIQANETINDILEKRNEIVFKDLEKKFKKSKLYLFEFPSKNKDETILLNGKEVFIISRILNEFIFNEYKGLAKVYFFISELSKISNLLDLPIVWKAPNGVEFTQHYHKHEKTHAKIRLFGIVKELHYINYTEKLDKNKQKNSIIPNVIHTLDASHVHEIILESIKNKINVITIHDCFGTHPNNMANIHHIVRKTFILQYSNHDFLNNFRNKIIDLIKVYDHKIIEENNITKLILKKKEYIIPQTPELGEFDLNQIEESKYIIC